MANDDGHLCVVRQQHRGGAPAQRHHAADVFAGRRRLQAVELLAAAVALRAGEDEQLRLGEQNRNLLGLFLLLVLLLRCIKGGEEKPEKQIAKKNARD